MRKYMKIIAESVAPAAAAVVNEPVTEFENVVKTMFSEALDSLSETMRLEEEAARNQLLVEKSMKVGVYMDDAGVRYVVHRSDNDPKHHMLIDQKGEVKRTPYGDPDEVHAELTADGLKGAIIRKTDA